MLLNNLTLVRSLIVQKSGLIDRKEAICLQLTQLCHAVQYTHAIHRQIETDAYLALLVSTLDRLYSAVGRN